MTRYVHADSNVARSVGLNTFYGQLIRVARISSSADSFNIRIKELFESCQAKGFNEAELTKSFYRFWNNWKPLLAKFDFVGPNAHKEFILNILSNQSSQD